MGGYVLDHRLEGERARLALMSRLLDPMHRRQIEALGIRPGARALEVGCGNGSVSAWLAERLGRSGRVVAVDLDLSLVEARAPNLELRQGNICAGPIDPGSFDLVTARAMLHHVADAEAAIRNLVAGLAPGGEILLIEPDFLPVSMAEPPEVKAFWDGWLARSREQKIDYHIGRTLASRLAGLGLEAIAGTAETAVYNGGSAWAIYWIDTVTELRARLQGSGRLDAALVDRFLVQCADPGWWTQTIAFTAVHARARQA
jgi:2-polyprenyl-3-methyl-5-hydroxy-6-metoxy-1,4-benzoquinol methylase